MAPLILNGDSVIFSTKKKIKRGVIVGVHFKSGAQPLVKRLTSRYYPEARAGDELSMCLRFEAAREETMPTESTKAALAPACGS